MAMTAPVCMCVLTFEQLCVKERERLQGEKRKNFLDKDSGMSVLNVYYLKHS